MLSGSKGFPVSELHIEVADGSDPAPGLFDLVDAGWVEEIVRA